MNTLTFLVVTLIVMYTFYIYKENIILKSEMIILKEYINKQVLQTKELVGIYKEHNNTNDLFVQSIDFNAKAALEHKAEREEMENVNDTTEQEFLETLESTQSDFNPPNMVTGLGPVPSEYDALLM